MGERSLLLAVVIIVQLKIDDPSGVFQLSHKPAIAKGALSFLVIW
jgi:hypothetical protein